MRRIILACALAGVLAVPAKAQSPKDQLVGVWALTSCYEKLPWCAKPGGLMILDASGYYTIVHIGLDRAKLANPQPREAIPAEEYKRIAMGVQVNCGTWSVDEAGKTLTWHIQGGLIPNVAGNDFKGEISLSGDELRLAPAQTWQRIKR
jgi:Lipocalin-like domain